MAKMIGFGAMTGDHLLGEGALGGEAEEDVGADGGLLQGAEVGVGGEELLVRVHPLDAPLVDDPLGVAHDHVVRLDAEGDGELGAGVGRGAGAVDDDADILDLLADEVEGVEQGGRGDDGGAVLVVVEDRDVHGLLQLFFDVEALGGLDVLQVDAAEGRLQELAGLDDLVRILGLELDVEDVDVGEALEEDPFPLHDRLARQRAEIAEAEDGGAVGDDRHQVPLGGVVVGIVRILFDRQAGLGDAGGIGEGEVFRGLARFGRGDLDLSFTPHGVIFEGS